MFPFIISCQKLANPSRLLTYSTCADAGEDKRGHLVEWVEKASFNRLNRLFEIASSERNYQMLLSSRNLLVVVRETQLYTLNILLRRLPKVVVSGEHFVLKDLPFYTKAHETDSQAHQERLSHREERRQEGTLWRAPGEKRRAPSPPACPPVQKKKRTLTKGIVIWSLFPSSLSTSTPPTLDSPILASEGASNFSRHDLHDSGFKPSVPKPEHLPLLVSNKPVVEKPDPSCSQLTSSVLIVIGKSAAERLGPSRPELESLAIAVLDNSVIERPIPPYDLRIGFSEKLHKRLYETIEIGSTSVQGDQPEWAQEEPGRKIPPVPVVSLDVESFGDVLAAEEETHPAAGGAYSSGTVTRGVSAKRDIPTPASPPSCFEMMEMLKRIPHFIEADLPSSNMFEVAKMVTLCFSLCFPNRCTWFLTDV